MNHPESKSNTLNLQSSKFQNVADRNYENDRGELYLYDLGHEIVYLSNLITESSDTHKSILSNGEGVCKRG